MRSLALAGLLVATSLIFGCASGDGQSPSDTLSQASTTSPYPPSTVFQAINWDFNVTRLAGGQGLDGSDLWAMDWGTNGDLYGVWGDGKGFGETSSSPSSDKAFMGVSRIVGPPPPTELGSSPTATNLWGGIGTSNPNKYTDGTLALGKGNVLLSVQDDLGNDVMVLSVAVQNPDRSFTGTFLVAYSLDQGKSWTKIANTGSYGPCGGLYFGPGYTRVPAALDGYVYGYLDQGNATGTLLCREPKSHFSKANIASLGAHTGEVQWFTGLSAQGNPVWGSFASARGVINDTRTESTLVTYDPALSRYLAIYEFNRPTSGDDTPMGPLAVLDAPNPWGPWTTVGYYQNWGNGAFSAATYNLGATILPNWLGPVQNGAQPFCLVFSGTGAFDSFNLLCNNQLVLRGSAQPLVTIESVSTGKAYDTKPAEAGQLLYIDRSYPIASLSSSLGGGTLIQTANNDKFQTTTSLLTFKLSRSATVHVVFDKRIAGTPGWLSGWSQNPADSLTSVTYPSGARIYSKAFAAGAVVTVGGNVAPPAVAPAGGSMSNYVVIAK